MAHRYSSNSTNMISHIHEKIAREMREERRGMTDALRRKIRRLPRNGAWRKITPQEYRAILEIFGGEDEDGKGWFNYEGHAVAYNPEKMGRF